MSPNVSTASFVLFLTAFVAGGCSDSSSPSEDDPTGSTAAGGESGDAGGDPQPAEDGDLPKAQTGDRCSTQQVAQSDETCGLNGRGFQLLTCQEGQWSPAGACLDPDVCEDGRTRPGPAFCGEYGKLEETCVAGSWRDSDSCVESDAPTADGFKLGDHSLVLGGGISSDGTIVYLEWEPQPAEVSVEVYRRPLPQASGAATMPPWEALGIFKGGTLRLVDDGLERGQAYEYKVYRAPAQTSDADYALEGAGYWMFGREVPYPTNRGTVLVYVDETLSGELAAELARLDTDLVGDGWVVKRSDYARHDTVDTAIAFRSRVANDHAKNPEQTRAVFLLGRLPFIKSGPVAPDHHYPGTEVATDQFAADLDGTWTDSDDDGRYENQAVPSKDGHATELRIGRADFAGMNAWPVDELGLTRAYLDKNHAYRQAAQAPERRALWSKLAYDDSPYETQAAVGFVGQDHSYQGDFEDDPDKTDDIHAEDPAHSYQWGIDFADWKGTNYPNYDFRIAFALNFGSGKHKWANNDNPLRALLCMEHFGLAAFWGVRPNWFIHELGLGGTLGDAQWRSVNANDDDYPVLDDYDYLTYAHGVWINLMGDPTLRNFPIAPPRDVHVEVTGGETVVSWRDSPEPSLMGYDVFRAELQSGPYSKLTTTPVLLPRFVDPNPSDSEPHYMVRAVRLETTGMGSYYNPSQGALASH